MTKEINDLSGSFDFDRFTPIEMAEISCVSAVTAIGIAAQVAQAPEEEAKTILLTVAATLPLQPAEAKQS